MLVIAHAGHWALSLLEVFPLIAIAAFAAWRTYVGRRAPAPAGASDELSSPRVARLRGS